MKVKIFLAVLLGMACNTATAEAEKTSNDEVQRIILVRHAEKPDDGLGNLTCQGLNRALLLPDYIQREFNKPDYIFAPNLSLIHI